MERSVISVYSTQYNTIVDGVPKNMESSVISAYSTQDNTGLNGHSQNHKCTHRLFTEINHNCIEQPFF